MNIHVPPPADLVPVEADNVVLSIAKTLAQRARQAELKVGNEEDERLHLEAWMGALIGLSATNKPEADLVAAAIWPCLVREGLAWTFNVADNR